MNKRLNILWLPAWYPSSVNFLNGDFTERHAEAVSRFANITVLYVVKDPSAKKRRIEVSRNEALTVYRAFYPGKRTDYAARSLSALRYYLLLINLYRQAVRGANFDFTHVHISGRQGFFARCLKRWVGLEYVITEQGSRFMPENKRFAARRNLSDKRNFQEAVAVHTVSAALGEALMLRFPSMSSYTVIPNVVNTAVFNLKAAAIEEPVFSAVAGNLYHKNTDTVIRAFSKFRADHPAAQLLIAGPVHEMLLELTVSLNLQDAVTFAGAIPNAAVAEMMQRSVAFVFFTRYETFGCVMAEALCCGVPVIASELPVLRENLLQNENAVFAESENETALVAAMTKFYLHKDRFNRGRIADQAAAKFNYDTVGKQILDFYHRSFEL